MINAESSISVRNHYNKREEANYWGVYWLNKENYTMSRIAEVVDIPRSIVQSIIKRIKEKGTPKPGHSSGGPKKLGERDERVLRRIVIDDPFASYNQLLSQLDLHQIHISRNNLIRYIRAQGFGSYFAAHKPRLTESHKKMKLRWAKERVNWSTEEWRGVVWSDESRFTVECYDGGARVIRKKGERYDANKVKPVSKFGRGNVMIWSCFWAGGFGPMVFIDGLTNQDSYVNILAKTFLSWFVDLSDRHNRDFIFQEDGATCHTGGYATWWKDVHQIRRFDKWPAQSPDLNPIEHVWSCLERSIEKKRVSISKVQELKVALEGAWTNISVDLAERLVSSMKDRCQAVIDAKGGPKRY